MEDKSVSIATTSLAINAFATVSIGINNAYINQNDYIYYICGVILVIGFIVEMAYIFFTDATNGAKKTTAFITAMLSMMIIIIMLYPTPAPSGDVAIAIDVAAIYYLFTNFFLMIGVSFAKNPFRLQT